MTKFEKALKFVEEQHCCRCPLRNINYCEYKKCSKTQFKKWFDEAEDIIEKELRE